MTHPLHLAIFLAFSGFITLNAHAMETDNLTGRHKELATLPDSTETLDRFVNERFLTAIQKTNSSGGRCNHVELIRNLRYQLNRNPIGEVESFGELDESVNRYLVPFDESIFGSLNKDAKTNNKMQKLFAWLGLKASSVRVNQQIVGTDKLGHFFSQGYEYFLEKDWQKALTYGSNLEKGIYGVENSGVYSYADLTANFNGYHFWRNIFSGSDPYVICQGGRYVMRRAFAWKDYVTPAWDEGINCSEFSSEDYRKAVEKQEKKHGVKCPAEPEQCAKLVQQPCAYYLVSPACFKAARVARIESKERCAQFFKDYADSGSCKNPQSTWHWFVDKIDEVWGDAKIPAHLYNQSQRDSGEDDLFTYSVEIPLGP